MICRHRLAHFLWLYAAGQVRIEGDLLFPDVRPERARQVWMDYSTYDMMVPTGLPRMSVPMINLDRLVIPWPRTSTKQSYGVPRSTNEMSCAGLCNPNVLLIYSLSTNLGCGDNDGTELR